MWLFWWIVFIAGLAYSLQWVHEYIVLAVLVVAVVGWKMIMFWADQEEED